MLAQTALIERHVIRSEVPGLIIDVAQEAMLSSTSSASAPRAASDASERWNSFVARFIADIRFDDPGQPPPRRGGNGWMRLPLPEGLYVNLYRSSGERAVGAQVRLAGVEGAALYEALAADRSAIDAEFAANGLTLAWREGEVPVLSAESTAPLPWDESAEELQRAWLGQAGNQLVNSLRPRLQRLGQELAA